MMLSLSSKLFKSSATSLSKCVPSSATISATAVSIQRLAFSTDGTMQGTVKWFDIQKGFGFIQPEDGSPDVFVHQTVIHAEGFRSLAEGEPVEFTTMTDARGRHQASRVTGPGGAFVQGAPRRTFQPRNNFGYGGGYPQQGGGYGGGYGGYPGGGYGGPPGGFGGPPGYGGGGGFGGGPPPGPPGGGFGQGGGGFGNQGGFGGGNQGGFGASSEGGSFGADNQGSFGYGEQPGFGSNQGSGGYEGGR